MRSFVLFCLIATLASIIGCTTGRTFYTEYNVKDVSVVIDSIIGSGTQIGSWKEWSFTVDDGTRDNFGFTSLYDSKGKARGSIQVRQSGDSFNIKIIDYYK